MRIIVLSYYNPWISGGGHRPICFLEQDLKKGHEVVFIFESNSELETISNFEMYSHPNLKLIRRNKENGSFTPVNTQGEEIISEDYLLNCWKPDYVRSHNPVDSYIEFLKKCQAQNIPHLYDQMDYWDGFPVQPWGEYTENEYITYSNERITISNWLVEKNKCKTNALFHMIPNAIKDSFANALSIQYTDVLNRQLYSRKRIVYSGAIWPEWFDWDIMTYLIEQRPEYDFIMIGAYEPSSDEDDGRNVKEIVNGLKKHNNTKFMGQISHEELIPYLKSCNVAIIPFVVNNVTEACSPLKCFEYLGASMPVVTTYLPEISDYPSVYSAKDKIEFLDLIDSLVESAMSQEQYQQIKDFISENTWKSRSDELEKIALEMIQR